MAWAPRFVRFYVVVRWPGVPLCSPSWGFARVHLFLFGLGQVRKVLKREYSPGMSVGHACGRHVYILLLLPSPVGFVVWIWSGATLPPKGFMFFGDRFWHGAPFFTVRLFVVWLGASGRPHLVLPYTQCKFVVVMPVVGVLENLFMIFFHFVVGFFSSMVLCCDLGHIRP